MGLDSYKLYVARDKIIDSSYEGVSLEVRRIDDEELFVMGTYEPDVYPDSIICIGLRFTASGYLDIRFDFAMPRGGVNESLFYLVNEFNATEVSSLNLSIIIDDENGTATAELKAQSFGVEKPGTAVDIFEFYLKELVEPAVVEYLNDKILRKYYY